MQLGISVKMLISLIEKIRGLSRKYLNDRSYKNKRNTRKVETVLNYALRRYEVEAIDKILGDLEDEFRPYNSKVLY